MSESRFARLQSKYLCKREFFKFAGLYISCHFIFLLISVLLKAIYGLTAVSGMIPFETASVFISCISTFLSFPFMFILIERVKNKILRDEFIFKGKLSYSVFCGVVLSLLPLLYLIKIPEQFETFKVMIDFIMLAGNGFLGTFLIFSLLTRKNTLAGHLKNTAELIQNHGLGFVKILTAFLIIGLLGMIVVSLPVNYLNYSALSNGLPIYAASIITDCAEFIFSIAAVIPMYVEIRIYSSVFFLLISGDADTLKNTL